MSEPVWDFRSVVPDEVVADVDVTRPNPARMYDYALGGKNNFPADRRAVDAIRAVLPEVTEAAWANRGFHQRAAIWLARHGVTQFIDIGCGLPTRSNTHTAVQKVNPTARVAYVDHDPMVIAHARALLAGEQHVAVFHGDIRDPDAILTSLRQCPLLDLAEPAGLLTTAVMHFIPDGSDPWGCLARLVAALARGSYLALSHATADQMPPLAVRTAVDAYQNASEHIYLRPRLDVEKFFAGLELVPPYPGAAPELCRIGLWGAEDAEAAADDSSQPWWAGVGRKP